MWTEFYLACIVFLVKFWLFLQLFWLFLLSSSSAVLDVASFQLFQIFFLSFSRAASSLALAFSFSIAKLWSLVRYLAFGADLCGGLGVLPLVPVEVLTGYTRSCDVGLGVVVIMLPESFMGDSEDLLFGVIHSCV